jgi:hypothetical protein
LLAQQSCATVAGFVG